MPFNAFKRHHQLSIGHKKVNALKIVGACAALAGVVAIAGCASTLFFPVKTAEKAADKLINDIWPDVAKAVATREAMKP